MSTNLKQLVEALMTFFQKGPSQTRGTAPEGLCPNCWGSQEYDGQIRELYRDRQIEVNNHEANYAFIQDFVVTHVDGIRLKKGAGSLECPTCHSKYDEP